MPQSLPEVFVHRALTAHLYARGYQVREELRFGSARFDTIAFTDGKVLGYEVKLTSWTRALRQVQVYKLCCDEVYLVIPSKSLSEAIVARCQDEGVGLVTIGVPPDWKFTAVLPAPPSTIRNQLHHANIQRIAAFE
jgi:hypothetical protein